MNKLEARLAAYDVQWRAKYDAEQLKKLGAEGHAFKNPDGSFSYPIDDQEDLENAIHAVGRGNADHDALRKYIIGRAKDMDLSKLIPDNWNADGSLADAKSEAHVKPTRSPVVLKRALSSLIEQPPAQTFDLQIRMGESGDENIAQFRGYASTTGQDYAVTDWLGEYRETINAGAFAKTLQEQRAVPLLFNHDGMPLASTGSGTSRLSEDGTGLLNEAGLDRRQALTNDLCIALQRGDVNKMSFSFRAIKDDWNDAYDARAVSELALYDTSIVTYPANPGTSAELRSAMRGALGREGVSLMWSVRSALGEARSERIAEAAEPAVEKALRALASADEAVCRAYGRQGRARTFLVASMLLQVREGKVLSADNQTMLQNALTALHEADDVDIPAIVKSLQTIDSALDAGQAGLAEVLGKANPDGDPDDRQPTLENPKGPNNSGLDGDAGGGSGGGGKNPILPPDGAGPRFATVEATRRMLERLRAL